MAFPTFREVISEVIIEIGLVNGSAVQTYTEPQVKGAIWRMFEFLCGKEEWEHLCRWNRFTLDEVTGQISGSLTGIRDVFDILRIEDTATGREIIKPSGKEYLDSSLATTTTATFYRPLNYDEAGFDTKMITFYPLTATGTVDIYAMHRPTAFTADDDIVPFPKNVIVLGAAWYTLAGDGLNPANADKAQGMFDIAYQDFLTRINTRKIGLGATYRARTFTIQ